MAMPRGAEKHCHAEPAQWKEKLPTRLRRVAGQGQEVGNATGERVLVEAP